MKPTGTTRAKPPATPAPSRRPEGRISRADKSAATHRKLIAAATQIVGLEGYANASVAKITARARVAQGTFYNYFESQQDLFDHLLPELGQQLLDYIRKRLAGCKEGLKREEIGFQAFFEFLNRTPEFYRVLSEAEMFSPKAYRDHMDNMTNGYVRALRKSQQKGALQGYSQQELDVLVCILLAARNYIAYHFIYRDRTHGPLPPSVVQTYMKFIAGGVGYGTDGTAAPRQKRANGAANAITPPRIDTVKSGPSAAVLKMTLSNSQLGSGGAVANPTLYELIETAAAAVAGHGAMRPPKLLNMSVDLLAPAHAGILFASAQCERRGDGIAHISVQIAEERRDGKAIATGRLLFAAPADYNPG